MKVSVPAVAPPTPPGDRRVEGERSGRRAHFVSALGALDVDGRAVDDEGLGRRGGQKIGVSREHMAPRRQHRHDRIGFRHGLTGAGGNGDA